MARDKFTKSSILALLDHAADPYFHAFPDLEMPSYLVETRLSAYRSSKRWDVLIEIVTVDPSSPFHQGIVTILYAFSSALGDPRLTDRNFLRTTSDARGARTFVWKTSGLFVVNPRAKFIGIRGKPVVLPAKREYSAFGIELRSLPYVQRHELIRCLAAKQRGLFFATDDEIQKRFRLPSTSTLLLRIQSWRHPRLSAGEMPSKTTTFDMIADVLVHGDSCRYRPTSDPNTHWSVWPEPVDV
jgi:hypothetical protein